MFIFLDTILLLAVISVTFLICFIAKDLFNYVYFERTLVIHEIIKKESKFPWKADEFYTIIHNEKYIIDENIIDKLEQGKLYDCLLKVNGGKVTICKTEKHSTIF